MKFVNCSHHIKQELLEMTTITPTQRMLYFVTTTCFLSFEMGCKLCFPLKTPLYGIIESVITILLLLKKVYPPYNLNTPNSKEGDFTKRKFMLYGCIIDSQFWWSRRDTRIWISNKARQVATGV